jgi:hypothetical protein
VEDKVNMIYSNASENLKNIISEFWEFLKWEALLLSIEEKEWNWDITSEFVSWDDKASITLIK